MACSRANFTLYVSLIYTYPSGDVLTVQVNNVWFELGVSSRPSLSHRCVGQDSPMGSNLYTENTT